MAKIALLMMLRNEERRIQVSLDSTVGSVDLVIIYDTGSVDSTLDIVKEHCAKHNLPVYIKEAEWVNFSTCRNASLDYAQSLDAEYDYLLLMDANDELRGGEILRNLTQRELNEPRVAYFVQQQLDRKGTINAFYNVRLLKRRCDWRYTGRVHETFDVNGRLDVTARLPEIILYQDREEDVEKSEKRYARDKELLLEDYAENPINPRTLYYLAQTCDSMNDDNSAYRFHKERAALLTGSAEERFLSTFRVAALARDPEESVMWYLKAYCLQARAEPLIKLSEYYYNNKQWGLAYHFSKLSCELEYPEQAFMYVDKKAYSYIRWAQLALTAFPAKHYEEGLTAALQAFNANGSAQDSQVLKTYQKIMNINDAEPMPK